MKAEELRIGNKILIHGKTVNVFRIVKGEISGQIIVNRKPLDIIDAIPLTEQWLIDFGFKKVIRQNIIQWENEYSLSHEFDNNGIFGFHIANGTWISCKYVHQLQNLYFALRGTELST